MGGRRRSSAVGATAATRRSGTEKRSNSASTRQKLSGGDPYSLHDLCHFEVLVHLLTQASRPVLLADVLVVGHAGEEVVATRRDVGVGRPLLALGGHVALFLLAL